MKQTVFSRRAARSAPLAAALMVAGVFTLRADTLTDNLSAATAGTETASGDTWVAASFRTDASSFTLSNVTLLLDSTDGGSAAVSVYSNGLLAPGSLLGTLTSSDSLSSALTPVTFSNGGLSLAADSTYWVVLQALGGSVDWAWTDDNTGTGVGYQGAWGTSSDAGLTWFTDDIYPTQLSVNAAAASTATPEPDALTLWFAGALLVGTFLKTRKRGA